MHRLEDRAHPPHIAVDLRVRQELGGQVGVQPRLDIRRRVDPQRWIEEDMVQQLPREKRETEQLRGISQVTYAVLAHFDFGGYCVSLCGFSSERKGVCTVCVFVCGSIIVRKIVDIFFKNLKK